MKLKAEDKMKFSLFIVFISLTRSNLVVAFVITRRLVSDNCEKTQLNYERKEGRTGRNVKRGEERKRKEKKEGKNKKKTKKFKERRMKGKKKENKIN